MRREPLSVVVTTFNNADTLDACLRSVAWAEEIVVLDSGSTDATVAIATHYSTCVMTSGAGIDVPAGPVSLPRACTRSMRFSNTPNDSGRN